MGRYFGTDGFRGEAGIDLTADHAYKVGRFLGWYYNALRERNGNNEPARIVIGKDPCRSAEAGALYRVGSGNSGQEQGTEVFTCRKEGDSLLSHPETA